MSKLYNGYKVELCKKCNKKHYIVVNPLMDDKYNYDYDCKEIDIYTIRKYCVARCLQLPDAKIAASIYKYNSNFKY